jgi:hypothetical protein
MPVMSTSFSGYSVREMTGGREHPLPSPFFSRVRVFTIERIGERDAAQTVVLVNSLDRLLAMATAFSKLLRRLFRFSKARRVGRLPPGAHAGACAVQSSIVQGSTRRMAPN